MKKFKKGKLYRLPSRPLTDMLPNNFATIEKGVLPGVDFFITEKDVLMCLQDSQASFVWDHAYVKTFRGTMRGDEAAEKTFYGYTFYTNYKTIFIESSEAEERLEEII